MALVPSLLICSVTITSGGLSSTRKWSIRLESPRKSTISSTSLQQRKIQLLTIFGAGLLVGTSLAVIIPEGVEMMYGQHHHHHEHATKRAAIVGMINTDLLLLLITCL